MVRGFADTYVTGDLLLYYRLNDRRRSVAPDLMVVKGVDTGPRRSYVLWEEGRAGDLRGYRLWGGRLVELEVRVADLEALLRDANALPRKPVGQ